MLSIKGGTQTWSTANQTSSLKGDGAQNISANDRDKVLGGDENIGDYLNKIADPNWVDPSKAHRVGNPNLDKDSFMKLFLAQLKNQDPTNPLQSHEMAAQLAQFTSLEKLDSIDKGIEGMTKSASPKQNYETLNMIGKTVSGDSASLIRSDEKETHDVEFTLGGDAQEATLSVRDANGSEVKKLKIGGLKKGKNSVPWDGRMENGTMAQPGEYKVVIEARNAGGQKLSAETAFKGKVTGVNFTAQGPVLMLGKQSVRMTEVRKITDDSIMEAVKNDVNQVKNVKEIATDNGAATANAAGMGSNLESIGMSQGLINNLSDQTEKVEKGGIKK